MIDTGIRKSTAIEHTIRQQQAMYVPTYISKDETDKRLIYPKKIQTHKREKKARETDRLNNRLNNRQTN